MFGNDHFSQNCLIAYRLAKVGVPFIALQTGGWDMHDNCVGGMEKNVPSVDAGFGGLVGALTASGLIDNVLVMVGGEFGRTPQVNKDAGRDHWSNAMSVLFAGGGTPGQVVGATDNKGFSAIERVLSPENFVSTIYSKLGINPDKMYYTHEGRPVHLVSDPAPIRELMG
jgi:uncharacterized protein (DUF1501 family)